jgi:hypothetical protein
MKLAQIADAINQKAGATLTPTFSAINFQASDGSTWQFRISPTGTILLDQVSAP